MSAENIFPRSSAVSALHLRIGFFTSLSFFTNMRSVLSSIESKLASSWLRPS